MPCSFAGAAIIQKVNQNGAEVKFEQSALALAATIATTYYLIAFMASYFRDIRLWEMNRKAPALRLGILSDQGQIRYTENLREKLKAMELIAMRLRGNAQRSPRIQGGDGEMDLHLHALKNAAEKSRWIMSEMNLLFGTIEVVESVDKVRRTVEVWLPALIALIAIASGAVFLYKMLFGIPSIGL